MADNATLSIPQDMIQPIIKAKVEAAVVEAFGGMHEIVAKVAQNVCAMKVDGSGKYDPCGYHGSKPLLEYVCANAVREAVEQAVREWMRKNAMAVRREVWRMLDDKKSNLRDRIAGAFMAALIDNKWELHVNVEPKKANND